MKIGTLVVLAALLFATDAPAQRSGQSMSVQTGVVVAAQAVNLQSAAGSGAAVGGVLGFATTSSRQGSSRRARNTILGAAAGGAIARRAQGDLNGMQYTVEVGPGSQITVVTDQTEVKVGDCVNVEQAGSGTANVRRVSPALCDAAFDNAVDEDISAEYDRLADMCLDAKESMMEAETDEALDVAIRRVNILCND
jgi:outer membrane lipoprotein SlyB